MPLYGETTKAQAIALINEKVERIQGEPFDLHLDVYDMLQESLHIILFELLVFRKLHVGFAQFATLPEKVSFYIEVTSTFNNGLRKALDYLDRFEGKIKLNLIEPAAIDIPKQKDHILQLTVRYLDAMDQDTLHKEQQPNGGDPVDRDRAQALLKKYFLDLAHNPNFYQL